MNAHTLVWLSLAMQADPEIVIPAADNPVPKSTLWWLIETMSLTGLFMILVGLVIFIGACFVVARSRRTSTIAAYLVLLPLPTYIGVLGQLKGIIASLSVIALSDVQLSTREVAGGLAESVLLIFVGLLVTLPSYLVLAYGLLSRECNSSSAVVPRMTTGPLPVMGITQSLMGERAMG